MSVFRPSPVLLLAGLVLIGLALRAGLQTVRSADLTIDRDAYLGIATALKTTGVYATPNSNQPTAFRPPLYPLLLATISRALPLALTVAVINLASAALTIGGTYLLARELGLKSGALLAAAWVTFDPLLLWSAKDAMTEGLFTGLLTLTLWLTVRWLHAPSWPLALTTGLTVAATSLCRPTLLPWNLYWLGLFVVAVGSPSLRSRHHPWQAAAILLLVSGTLSLWGLRNLDQLGHFIPTTTHGGYTLLLGNNPVFFREVVQGPPGATWSYDSLTQWQADLHRQQQADLALQAKDEVAVDRWCNQRARQWISNHPQQFLTACLYRLQALWSLGPRGPESASLPTVVRLGISAFYAIWFTAAAWGLIILVRQNHWSPQAWAPWIPLLLWAAVLCTVHLFYWTDTRMRAPLHPVLACLAAIPLSQYLQSRQNRDNSSKSGHNSSASEHIPSTKK